MTRLLQQDIATLRTFIATGKQKGQVPPITDQVLRAYERLQTNPTLKDEFAFEIDQYILPSCLQCGACCRRVDWTVDAEGCELDDPEFSALTVVTSSHSSALRMMKKQSLGQCAALDTTNNHCTIYTQRPTTCRDFARGSWQCMESLAKLQK